MAMNCLIQIAMLVNIISAATISNPDLAINPSLNIAPQPFSRLTPEPTPSPQFAVIAPKPAFVVVPLPTPSPQFVIAPKPAFVVQPLPTPSPTFAVIAPQPGFVVQPLPTPSPTFGLVPLPATFPFTKGTRSPTGVTTSPSSITGAPTSATSTPTTATNPPSSVTDSPTEPSPNPTESTPSPSETTSVPTIPTESPTQSSNPSPSPTDRPTETGSPTTDVNVIEVGDDDDEGNDPGENEEVVTDTDPGETQNALAVLFGTSNDMATIYLAGIGAVLLICCICIFVILFYRKKKKRAAMQMDASKKDAASEQQRTDTIDPNPEAAVHSNSGRAMSDSSIIAGTLSSNPPNIMASSSNSALPSNDATGSSVNGEKTVIINKTVINIINNHVPAKQNENDGNVLAAADGGGPDMETAAVFAPLPPEVPAIPDVVHVITPGGLDSDYEAAPIQRIFTENEELYHAPSGNVLPQSPKDDMDDMYDDDDDDDDDVVRGSLVPMMKTPGIGMMSVEMSGDTPPAPMLPNDDMEGAPKVIGAVTSGMGEGMYAD